MKVKVNRDACIGCGACAALCEDVFEIDDEGISTVKVEEVSEDLEESVRELIDGNCPVDAISEVSEEE